MKILAFLLFFSVVTISLGQEQVGRYQIIVLKVPTGPSADLSVLKLDTATGQTWKFVDVTVPIPASKQTETMKKVGAEGWMLIDDDIQRSIKNAQEMVDKISRPAK